MKKELQQTIGHNLQQIRVARGLTRKQVADRVGISVSFYANLESGNRMMSVPTLCKIADVFCASTDSLIYKDQMDSQHQNIEGLLNKQTPKAADLSEKIIRLITNELRE